MARTLYRLTDRILKNLDKPGYHADGGGLYLQISKSKTKSWILEATEPLGPTFKQFARQYVEGRADTWRSEKHASQWFSTLERYAYPVIGKLQLDEIDTPHILQILEPMWKAKSETASRLRGRIERILAAAAVRGLRPASNPATWVGHLREALPPKKKSEPFAALPYQHIPTFLQKLRNVEGIGARALEFLILTASRSTQARGVVWSEIDFNSRVWLAPGDRMKAGRPHQVPLSERALALLEEMRPLGDLPGNFVFPGLKLGCPLSDMTLTSLLRDMGYTETVHGFRASFKTWAEQETNHPNVVIEAALAHIVGDKAEQAYMRGDWLEKRRALMLDWALYCSSTPQQTVLPFSKKQAG